jgi:hypothetical protein
MKTFDEFYSREDSAIDTKDYKKPDPNFFGGLGAMNTVADFVSELSDSLFRDILGNETMDRTLGSFEKEDLFRVMAKIFLNTGFERWMEKS